MNASEKQTSTPAVERGAQQLEAPLHFDRLLERCMGSQALAERVLNRFCEVFPNDFEELQTLWDDSEALRLKAHGMKSAAASVSADSLAQALADIESVAVAATPEQSSQYLKSVEQEWKCLSEYLSGAMSIVPEPPQ